MSIRVPFVVLPCVILATACGGGGGGGSTESANASAPSSPTSSSILPSPGVWNASAGFGTFELTVNGASTAIPRIACNFQSWQCGGVTRSGGVAISTEPGWPITNNQFSIQTNIDSNLSMSIQGTFGSATSASGSWSANSGGSVCSGTWTASR